MWRTSSKKMPTFFLKRQEREQIQHLLFYFIVRPNESVEAPWRVGAPTTTQQQQNNKQTKTKWWYLPHTYQPERNRCCVVDLFWLRFCDNEYIYYNPPEAQYTPLPFFGTCIILLPITWKKRDAAKHFESWLFVRTFLWRQNLHIPSISLCASKKKLWHWHSIPSNVPSRTKHNNLVYSPPPLHLHYR